MDVLVVVVVIAITLLLFLVLPFDKHRLYNNRLRFETHLFVSSLSSLCFILTRELAALLFSMSVIGLANSPLLDIVLFCLTLGFDKDM